MTEPLVFTITLPAAELSTKEFPEIVTFEEELETAVPSAPNTIGSAAVADAKSRPVPKFARIAPLLAKS